MTQQPQSHSHIQAQINEVDKEVQQCISQIESNIPPITEQQQLTIQSIVPHLTIQKSRISADMDTGWGLFYQGKDTIPKNTLICVYSGPTQSWVEINRNEYTMNLTNGTSIDGQPKHHQNFQTHLDQIQAASIHYSFHSHSLASYANTLKAQSNCIFLEMKNLTGQVCMYIETITPIHQYNEITVNYDKNYDYSWEINS